MHTDLVQIHHSDFLEDIPFWKSLTEDRDPVLEIGCGHGRVTIPLLEAGRRVTGIDMDGQSLQYLADLLKQGLPGIEENVEIIQDDVFCFQTDEKFGSVIVPCNTYSTFFHPQRLELTKKIHTWLKPGGLFVASLPNPANLKFMHDQLIVGGETDQEVETDLVHPLTGNPIQVSSRFHAKEDRLGWDWIYDHLLPDGRVERVVRSAEHDLASLASYQEELHQAGYGKIEIHGDYRRGEYSEDSPYLILICGK